VSPSEERRRLGIAFEPIRGLARRLNTAILLSSLVGPVWSVVAAVALWRFAVQRWVPAAAVTFAVGGVAVAWRLTRAKLITHRQAAVMVDRHAGAGGLFLTRLETGIGEWETSLRAMVAGREPPRVEYARAAGAHLLALVFLVAALSVPLPRPFVRPIHAAAASRVDELAQKLEVVAKEQPVEAEARKELEQLREAVKEGDFAPADWEAADSLAKELERKAEEAGARLLKADEAAEKLAAAMDDARTLEVLTRERDELERALMDLSSGSEQAAETRSPWATEQGSPAMSEGEKRSEPSAQRHADQPAVQNEKAQHAEPSPGDPRKAEPHRGEETHRSAEKAPQTSERIAAPSPSGQQGPPAKGGQAPTRAQIEELRKALQQRREQLAKAFPGGSERRASTASRTKRSSTSGQKRGSKGARSSPGAPEGESGPSADEEAKGEGKSSRVARELGGEHASRMMKGDPTHGPADDTPLVFAGRAEMDPTRLAMKPTPEGSGGEGAELLGLVAADPARHGNAKITPRAGAAASGDEGPANRERNYLPRNQALIQRYFDSPK
jgi:hypothetical protein